MRSLTVIVQAMPERPTVDVTLQSLKESDLPEPDVLFQPKALTPSQFFLSGVLSAMASAETDLVLRLEDDVLVNRHCRHNIETWDAVDDPRFGLGWLFDPGGSCQTVVDRIYGRLSPSGWRNGPIHGALGVLATPQTVRRLIPHVEKYQQRNPGPIFDLSLAAAVGAIGQQICVHSPSLLEHQAAESTLGHWTHPEFDTSGGTFQREWRR